MRDRLMELINNSCVISGADARADIKTLTDFLLANGVIVPPCEVGDTVYHLKNIYKGKKCVDTVIERLIVDSFVIGDNNTLQVNTCDNARNEWCYYEIADFDRYVFVKPAEAEKALKEHEDNDL